MDRIFQIGIVAARILIAVVFVPNGLGIIDQTIPAKELMERGALVSLVPVIRLASRVLELAAGFGLALFVFLVPATFISHPFWLTLMVTDWLRVIVNPSWLSRLPHMLTAAYLAASFLLAGVGAFYLLRRKHTLFARKSVSIGMAFAAILIAGPVFIGDILYSAMLKHQPSKMRRPGDEGRQWNQLG